MSSERQVSPIEDNVSRLALGTVQFGLPYGVANTGDQVPLATAEAMVGYAAACGVDTIDTAIGYGESEQVLGRIGVGNFKVVSKLLPLPVGIPDARAWVLSETAASLARLGVGSLHGLLLHRSSDLVGTHGPALYAAMLELKRAGTVRKIGVSIYSPAELDAYFDAFDFDLIQAPFNLIDHRLATSGWLQRLKACSCEVHVRSAFLQGLLLMPRTAIPAKFSPWNALWDRWHTWLAQHHEDAIRVCLAFPLSFPEIDRIVVGALDLAQLEQIAVAAERSPGHLLPDLTCDDEKLINPAKWPSL